MVFVGAAIFPHGSPSFDGDVNSSSEKCRERRNKLPPALAQTLTNAYNGMRKTADMIADMDPDIVVLHSPHGIVLDHSIGVHTSPIAVGNCGLTGCWNEFEVNITLDQPKSEQLVEHFKADGIQTEGISCFFIFGAPIRWSEAVPAWHIQKSVKKPIKYILVSECRQPWPISSVTEDRLRVGRSLKAFVDSLEERVAVVISAHLAHTYHSDYPDPLYQKVPGINLVTDHLAASAMERAFIGWVKSLPQIDLFEGNDPLPEGTDVWSPGQALPWLQKAAILHPTAYACGLIGVILLHAFLESQGQSGAKVKADVVSCDVPTYFCLMTATFSLL